VDLPRLTVKRTLTWADAWSQRTGEWPKVHPGPVPEATAATWKAIDDSLKQGSRGLRGASLARLRARHRGVRSQARPPRLTVRKVLGWARAHRRRTGRWLAADSGLVVEAPGETWNATNQALPNGVRGLKGKTSLLQWLQDHLAIPAGRQPLDSAGQGENRAG
jgi:hypothetical protein